MDELELAQNHETGLWERSDGRRFVRNEFDPNETLWIDVTGHVWTYSLGGRGRKLDWQKGSLPEAITAPLKALVCDVLRVKSASWSDHAQLALMKLGEAATAHRVSLIQGWGSLTIEDWALMWRTLPPTPRTILRLFYREMANRGVGGANPSIALELDEWIASRQPDGLLDVLTWNAQRGAYTSEESELVRRAFAVAEGVESDREYVTRVWGWMLFETYKRPLQLLRMRRDALVVYQDRRPQYFLRVPKVKAQSGDSAELWPISEALGHAVQGFAARPMLAELQERFDRLIVVTGHKRIGRAGSTWSEEEYGLDVPMEWHKHGQVSTARMTGLLQSWSASKGIISPRTRDVLTIGAKRIRHTGGTRLAMQGTPRDEIQAIFEHDDPSSAQAYIDAVGSDLIPAVERADRALGGLFAGLNAAYFLGTLVSEVRDKPIVVPDFRGETPAVVGGCGSDAACPKHPFWACYGGCPHFHAWRKGDHQRALDYVQGEHRRWHHAEFGKERSKLGKDFEQVCVGITEVMSAIEREDSL